jgi:rubredoxin
MAAMFFEYDPDLGNSITGIKQDTEPRDFPDEWKCPDGAPDKTS